MYINNLFIFIAEKYVRDGCTSLVNHSFIHWKASVWFAVLGHYKAAKKNLGTGLITKVILHFLGISAQECIDCFWNLDTK